MGKWCLHASSFIFDRIIIKVTGKNLGRVRASGFHGPFICFFLFFFLKRFDLGTLDSGERSLPFGLLVFNC